MTTIVCNRSAMASDSLCMDDATTCSVSKIFKINKGLVGVAGAYADCITFINWLREADDDVDELPDMGSVEALVLTAKGIWLFDGHHTPFKIKDEWLAIGSGAQAASAAMHLGLSPKEAVRIAAKVDPRTGGRIVEKKI